MATLHLSDELKPMKLQDYLIDKMLYEMPLHTAMYLHINALAKKNESIEVIELAKRFHVSITDVYIFIAKFTESGYMYTTEPDSLNNINVTFANPSNVEEIKPVPHYSMDKIQEFTKDPEIANFFAYAKASFNKIEFTPTEYEQLLSFHTHYKLPLEVITVIIDHCVMENKLNLTYAEALCRDFLTNGIKTVSIATDYLSKSQNIDNYTRILDAIGMKGDLKPAQQKIIDEWFNDLGFSIEIILEACDKACLSTNNPNLNYINGILNNWHNAGVQTIDDIKEVEKNFGKKTRKKSTLSRKQDKKSSLSNYSDGDIDFDLINELERKYIGLQ